TIGFNQDLLQNSEYTDPSYLLDETWTHAHQLKPEAMIYTVLPVMPLLARTYVEDDDGIKNDDITVKYDDILKLINLYNTFNSDNTKKTTVSTRRGHVKTKANVERDIMNNVWALVDNKDDKSKMTTGVNAITKAHRSIKVRII